MKQWLARVVGLLGVVLLAGAILGGGSANSAEPDWVVVASKLDNPRGLAFNASGRLIVGEAGHGGDVNLGPGPEGGDLVLGLTSKISAINVADGSKRVMVGGLISAGVVGATGVDGVSAKGRTVGIITASPQALAGLPPNFCASQPADCRDVLKAAKEQVGQLIQAQPGHTYKKLAPVGRFNYQYIVDNKDTLDPDNPDFQPGDANPYGVFANRNVAYVVDGGSNTLTRVNANGRMKVLAYLPNPPGPADKRFPYDAVPTCVTKVGDDLFIGDLAGRLWKWDGEAMTQLTVPEGLHFTACAADTKGSVYLVSIFSFGAHGPEANSGKVIRYNVESGESEIAAKGLNQPGGVAIDGDGQVYVSNNSTCPADVTGLEGVCPASGEVVRLNFHG